MTVSTPRRSPRKSDRDGPLYRGLVTQIREMIDRGTLRPGDRVPSVRKLKQQSKRSVSTILHAYQILEGLGLIEARPQSGYYVRHRAAPETAIACSAPPRTPQAVNVVDRLTRINREMCDPSLVPLGGAHPGKDLLPTRQLYALERTLSRVSPRGIEWYEFPAGAPELQHSIARHAMTGGCRLAPDDIIVTCGAQEALVLCLRAVVSPGDIVAVESPTYFGVLQALESLHIRAIEVPTDPTKGLDLAALESALKRRRVKAVIASPNAQNPLGFVTSDEHKRGLVALITRYNVPLIEDDVYGDLTYSPHRPMCCKSVDTDGLVMLCSSFSKTLAPGMRIGWCAPGRWREAVERLKFCSTIASPTLSQRVIAAFIDGGGYARHLRRVVRVYEHQTRQACKAILDTFPQGTSVTAPSGGFVTWIEMPEHVDAMALADAAIRSGISIAPGPIFSPSGRYRHHIRLSLGYLWTERIATAIRRLGAAACDLAVRQR